MFSAIFLAGMLFYDLVQYGADAQAYFPMRNSSERVNGCAGGWCHREVDCQGKEINVIAVGPCTMLELIEHRKLTLALMEAMEKCEMEGESCSTCKLLDKTLLGHNTNTVGPLFEAEGFGIFETGCCVIENKVVNCDEEQLMWSFCAKSCNGKGSCDNATDERGNQCCTIKCV